MQEVKGSTPFISTVEIEMGFFCGSSSVGRASASQAEGRGFESRFPLKGVGRIRKETPTPFLWRPYFRPMAGGETWSAKRFLG